MTRDLSKIPHTVVELKDIRPGMLLIGNTALVEAWAVHHRVLKVNLPLLVIDNVSGHSEYLWNPPANVKHYVLDEIGPEYGEICP